MIKKILLGLLAVLALLMGYAAIQPSEYTISREVSMNAPASKIFPYINNAKKMNEWNPFMKLDPKAHVQFIGPEEGVGAITSWEGGDQLGTGSATVSESVENKSVTTNLVYLKPFKMRQVSSMTLTPTGQQTTLRWSASGENNFIGRFMCMFMDMDKMVGGTFEDGLKDLKSKVEAEATANGQ